VALDGQPLRERSPGHREDAPERAGLPEPTGEFEDLGADSLVLALGQDTDLSLLDEATDITIADGVVEVSPMMMAASNGIFAGGDAVPSERTATIAIGHAKRAARGIDAFLAGRDVADTPRAQLATFERLNTWYYADAERAHRPELEIARRQNTFEEIVGGSPRRTPSSRRVDASRAATASSATTATGSVPTTPSSSSAQPCATRSTTTSARAAGSASANARAARSIWCRADLTSRLVSPFWRSPKATGQESASGYCRSVEGIARKSGPGPACTGASRALQSTTSAPVADTTTGLRSNSPAQEPAQRPWQSARAPRRGRRDRPWANRDSRQGGALRVGTPPWSRPSRDRAGDGERVITKQVGHHPAETHHDDGTEVGVDGEPDDRLDA